jgi:hypothetical protein
MSEPYWVPLGAAGGMLDPAGIGTSLPVSPVDGQEFVLVDSLTAPTFAWRFRYIAAKATNKWLFIGGAPLIAQVDTSDSFSSTSYANPSPNPGPSIAVPVAGDYIVGIGFNSTGVASGPIIYMSYDIGATPASDDDWIGKPGATATAPGGESRFKKKSFGAVTVTAKYKAATTTTQLVDNRWMSIEPIAVGG